MKQGLLGSAIVAGVVMGVAIFMVRMMSIALKWELHGQAGQGWIVYAIFVAGSIIFGRKYAADQGDAGLTYGAGLGFIVLSMLFVGVITGLGEVIAQKMIAPQYFTALLDKKMALAEQAVAANPILKNNPAEMEKGVAITRLLFSHPASIFFGVLLLRLICGTFVGLFTAVFVKRPADPFHTDTHDEYEA